MALGCALLFAKLTFADTGYYRHIFFDNSITSDLYFHSSGKVSSPSSLLLSNPEIQPALDRMGFRRQQKPPEPGASR